MPTPGESIRSFTPCGAPVGRGVFAFTPDGSEIAVPGDGACLELVATGAVVIELAKGKSGMPHPVVSVRFSPDGKTLWAQSGGKLEGWNVATATQTRVIPAERAYAFTVSDDGLRLFGLNAVARELWVWDANDGSLVAHQRVAPEDTQGPSLTGPFVALPDDRHLLAASMRGYWVADTSTGQWRPVPQGSSLGMGYVALSWDGQVVAMAAEGGGSDLAPTLLVLASNAIPDLSAP